MPCLSFTRRIMRQFERTWILSRSTNEQWHSFWWIGFTRRLVIGVNTRQLFWPTRYTIGSTCPTLFCNIWKRSSLITQVMIFISLISLAVSRYSVKLRVLCLSRSPSVRVRWHMARRFSFKANDYLFMLRPFSTEAENNMRTYSKTVL